MTHKDTLASSSLGRVYASKLLESSVLENQMHDFSQTLPISKISNQVFQYWKIPAGYRAHDRNALRL